MDFTPFIPFAVGAAGCLAAFVAGVKFADEVRDAIDDVKLKAKIKWADLRADLRDRF